MASRQFRRGNKNFLDAISLPVIDSNVSLKRAKTEMRRAGRSGLVVRYGKDVHQLVTTQEISGVPAGLRLKDLKGISINVSNLSPIAESTVDPYLSSDLLLDDLRKSGKKFGLLSAPTEAVKSAILYGLEDMQLLFREPNPDRPKKTKGLA